MRDNKQGGEVVKQGKERIYKGNREREGKRISNKRNGWSSVSRASWDAGMGDTFCSDRAERILGEGGR